MRTLEEIQADSMARTSFVMVMLAIAASVALLLGVVGIYGVVSYTAVQRTREIGARTMQPRRRSEARKIPVPLRPGRFQILQPYMSHRRPAGRSSARTCATPAERQGGRGERKTRSTAENDPAGSRQNVPDSSPSLPRQGNDKSLLDHVFEGCRNGALGDPPRVHQRLLCLDAVRIMLPPRHERSAVVRSFGTSAACAAP